MAFVFPKYRTVCTNFFQVQNAYHLQWFLMDGTHFQFLFILCWLSILWGYLLCLAYSIHQISSIFIIFNWPTFYDFRYLEWWVFKGRVSFLGVHDFNECQIFWEIWEIVILKSVHFSILWAHYFKGPIFLGHKFLQTFLTKCMPAACKQSGKIVSLVQIFA